MNARFVIFLTTILGFLLGSGFYVGHRITTTWSSVDASVIWVGVYAIILLQISGPFLYRLIPSQTMSYFVGRWIVFSFMGIGATLILYTLLSDAVIFAVGVVSPSVAEHLAPFGVGLALSMVVVTNIIGAVQMIVGPRVYAVDVPLPTTMRHLDGFKIAQISDLHVGPTISRLFVEKVVRRTNDLGADIIALTGDLIDGKPEVLRESCRPLASLKSRHGVFVVLGNHEFYWRAATWVTEYESMGFRPLNNVHQIIDYNDGRIAIAGVPDRASTGMAEGFRYDPEQAAQGIPLAAYKILLAHQPKSSHEAQKFGFDLMLSGHTHGGQFFPFTLLVRLAERFVRGLYRSGNLWIYVNRGTGYWGPPIRFLVPPEITLITLKA
jgi:predicted MPP superfamily phosphohydrolase